MPNWCTNNVLVYGPSDDRHRLEDSMLMSSRTELSLLDVHVPMPDILSGTVVGQIDYRDMPHEFLHRVRALSETGYSNWYSWRIDHWGTKWPEAALELVDRDDQFTHLRFDTAWSPALIGYCAMSTVFPTLTFVYDYLEPGMGSYGVSVIHNGVQLYTDEAQFDDWDDTDDPHNAMISALQSKIEDVDYIYDDLLTQKETQ